MEQNDLMFIQNQIGYEFENLDLLQQAFIRRSFSEENGGENNEVLEFIGDKVLDLFAVKYLTEKHGFLLSEQDDTEVDFDEFSCEKTEAELTEIKKILVLFKTHLDKRKIFDENLNMTQEFIDFLKEYNYNHLLKQYNENHIIDETGNIDI